MSDLHSYMRRLRDKLRPGYLPPWLLLTLLFAGVYLWFTARPSIESYSEAKYYLENDVFFDHPVTLYCAAEYDADKEIELPPGVLITRYARRAERMEWEHIVPAENFGRHFREWRHGHPDCVRGGRKFYGRKCVAKVNDEFRKMEADMYNLYPSIGSVNAARGNRQYALLGDVRGEFGSCGVKIKGKKFEPPDRAKGKVARASLYMAKKYEKFSLSPQQRKLFEAWDRAYPVDKWECRIAKRIEKLQGNANDFIKKPCEAAGLY